MEDYNHVNGEKGKTQGSRPEPAQHVHHDSGHVPERLASALTEADDKTPTPKSSVRAYVDTNVWIHYLYRPREEQYYLNKHRAAKAFFEACETQGSRVKILMTQWGYAELLDQMLSKTLDFKILRFGFLPLVREFNDAKNKPGIKLTADEKTTVKQGLDNTLANLYVNVQNPPAPLDSLPPLILAGLNPADALHYQQAVALGADFFVTQDGAFKTATHTLNNHVRVVSMDEINRTLTRKN